MMVQDLRAVNASPLCDDPHTSLHGQPYNILAQIPEDAKWFTMLDLENVFFASQFIHYHNICLPLSGLTSTQAKGNNIPGQYCLRSFRTAKVHLVKVMVFLVVM